MEAERAKLYGENAREYTRSGVKENVKSFVFVSEAVRWYGTSGEGNSPGKWSDHSKYEDVDYHARLSYPPAQLREGAAGAYNCGSYVNLQTCFWFSG